MKLVQLLAKELREWPESATFIVQDENKNVWSLDKGVDLSYEDSEWKSKEWFDLVLVDGSEILIDCLASDNKTSKVTQDQWQAEREKMNKPKWIRHRGGKCPVDDGTNMEYRLRDGSTISGCHPQFANWGHYGVDADIMAYRVIEETKDQEIEKVKDTEVNLEIMQGDSWVAIGRLASDFGDSLFDGCQPENGEEVKDKNLGTLTYKLEVDTSSAMTALNELSAKWDQIESPLKWRDEIIELEAYEEEFRREREKLIRKLESEGFKLIDHIAPVYGEQIIDLSDWRNWQAGDIVEVVANESSHDFDIGEEVVVSFIDNKAADLAVKAEYKDGRDYWWLAAKDGKFMRRP